MSARDANLLAAIHLLQERGFTIVSPAEKRAGYTLIPPGGMHEPTLEKAALMVRTLSRLMTAQGKMADVECIDQLETSIRELLKEKE